MAVALNLGMKFDYFVTEWQDRPDWIRNAEKEVHKLWTTEYKHTLLETNQLELPLRHTYHGSKDSGTSVSLPESSSSTSSQFALSEFGTLPIWKRNKRARIAADKLDPYDRFIPKEVEDELPAGPLQYWLDRRSDRHQEELAKIGMEIFSIPAMSADPERLFSRYSMRLYLVLRFDSTNRKINFFSSTKLLNSDRRNRLGDDVIEAIECLKSWSMAGFGFAGIRSEIKEMENTLKALEVYSLGQG